MNSRSRATVDLILLLGVVAGAAILAAPLVLESADPAENDPSGAKRMVGPVVPVDSRDRETSQEGARTRRPEAPLGRTTSQALPARPSEGFPTEVNLGEEVAWIDGTAVPYTPASAFVLPGEQLHIDIRPAPGPERMIRSDSAGRLESVGENSWVWTAPDTPGVHTLRVVNGERPPDLVLRAFVIEPAESLRDGRLNGYRVGHYPRQPLRGDTMYIRPTGFVEVTEANRDLRVSPRFQLKHFETKQGGGFPRYVVLQRKLLTKLELIVDALVERGYPVSSLHVMSGYRTPSYNERIGNERYSRHQWGDASDIFVDEDGNGWMDDLNEDGHVTRADARVLYEIVDSLDHAIETRRLLGGLGLYGPNSRRGPFVHVDTRGRVARW